jgi:hypothetical protein
MSGSKWWKMVLSGARGKYGEIISKNFKSNYFNKEEARNKSNQNQINLNGERNINENKIKRNKFGFPFYK